MTGGVAFIIIIAVIIGAFKFIFYWIDMVNNYKICREKLGKEIKPELKFISFRKSA